MRPPVLPCLWSCDATRLGIKDMTSQTFSTAFSVDQTPEEVFDAIVNVRGWWGEDVDGSTDALGAEFIYRYKDVHRCTLRVTDLVPAETVTWLVVDNYFAFTEDAREWEGTEMHFEIVPNRKATEIRFTHRGLVPDYECFEVCSNSWNFYLRTSLRALIRTGKGLPNPLELQFATSVEPDAVAS
jgi:Activator of Hsp90 ATPase homolog 1-like protein